MFFCQYRNNEFLVLLSSAFRSGGVHGSFAFFKQKMIKIISRDKKNVYNLNQTADGIKCTCPGFVYRGKCKHQSLLKPEAKLLDKLNQLKNAKKSTSS